MISGSTKWRKKTDIKFRYRHKKGPKGPFFQFARHGRALTGESPEYA